MDDRTDDMRLREDERRESYAVSGDDVPPPPPRWQGTVKWTGIIFAGIIGLFLVVAIIADFVNLAGPVSRIASRSMGRPVTMDEARIHLFTFTPRLEIRGLKVSNAAWARANDGGPEDMATGDYVAVSARLMPLFVGRLIVQSVEIDKPSLFLVRQADGATNFDSAPKPGNKEKEPTKLPAIKTFSIKNGHIHVVDHQRKLVFEGMINSTDNQAGQNRVPFRFTGTGTLNGAPFKLLATGNSLANVDPDKPYTMTATLEAGATQIEAQGTIPRPFHFDAVAAQLSIKGNDLADLYKVTGLALPNTPPYQISTKLERSNGQVKLTNFEGTIGHSDVHGQADIDVSHERPVMDVTLQSKGLDVRDLGALFGARLPNAQKAPVPAEPSKEATKQQVQTLLIPDAKLDLQRVRGMDATLNYRADALRIDSELTMKEVTIALALKDGVLTIDPLKVTLPQGAVAGRVRIDATQDVPRTAVDLTLKNAHLENFIKTGDTEPPIEGVIQGRIKLEGAGISAHRAAADADGQVAFVIPQGKVRQAFAALLGVDVSRGLPLLLSQDQSQSNLRCGVLSFEAKDGLADAKTFVIDTDVTRADGSGTVNLKNEAIDLTIKGEPKKVSLRVRAPIAVGGTLARPSIGIEPGPLAAQTGVAAAAGVFLTPLASIIAFVDPGLGDDANCTALIGQAKAAGVPAAKPPAN